LLRDAVTYDPEWTGRAVGAGVSIAGAAVGAEAIRRGAIGTGIVLSNGGAVAGAMAAEATRRAVGGAATAGAIGGAARAAAAAAGGDPIVDAVKKVGQDILETPKDVIKHVKENLITSITEGVIYPPLIIVDAKRRKWFGK
jgi:hypothetical protein